MHARKFVTLSMQMQLERRKRSEEGAVTIDMKKVTKAKSTWCRNICFIQNLKKREAIKKSKKSHFYLSFTRKEHPLTALS